MGFYDYRCAVTGLSLRAERAVMIWLWRSEGTTWTPVSLPIRGTYNRLGSIDAVRRNFNTRLLADAFRDALEVGQLELTGHAAQTWKDPGRNWDGTPQTGIDLVLSVIERSTTMGCLWGAPPTKEGVRFAGRRLAHTLIAERIYDAVLENVPAGEAGPATPALVEAAFPSALGRAIYGDLPESLPMALEESGDALEEFIRFRGWFERRATWAPGGDGAQHGHSEDLAFHSEARRRFVDLPWMLEGIDEIALRRELDDEPGELPVRWVRDGFASWYGLTAGGRRLARTSLAGLRAGVEALVLGAEPAQLIEAPAAVFTMQRGEVGPAIDLRPLIRLDAGGERATLEEKLKAEELATRPGTTVRAMVNWDEIEQQLPKLEEPLAAPGSERLVPVTNGTPAWAKEDERWGLIRFAKVD